MKKISKIFISLILLSLCSGCTINYNIEITSDSVKENIEITDTETNGRNKTTILKEYNRWIPAYIDTENDIATSYDSSVKSEEFEYHEKSIKELTNGYYYTYKYNYPIDKYSNAIATREAYQKRKFYIGDDYIIINTDNENLLCNYSYFENLKVSISVDPKVYKLNYTNADQKNSNTYIWNIDKNNCNNSEILLKLDIIDNKNNDSIDKPNNNPNNNNSNKNNDSIINDYILYIFLVIIALLILLGYKWFNNFKEKNNNID